MTSETHTEQATVLVIGEALIDAVNTNGHTKEHPGGSPANVALGLIRLGVPTSLLTKIGNDARGKAITNHLKRAGVSVDPASTGPAPTSLATATIGADGSAHYDFDLHWSFSTPSSPTRHHLIHTGSAASFDLRGWKELFDYIESKSDESLITYDPNIRPALLGDRVDAVDRFETWCKITDAVKLSAEDTEWLYPGHGPDAVADRILGLGTALVAITAGDAGSSLYTGSRSVTIPPIPTTVIDTIGAGDSYMSALILGLLSTPMYSLDRKAMERIGQAAARAAAITVSRAGANPPTLTEILQSDQPN
ncbi:carbohydrate kinase [Arthrobacter sp. MI7-26]|uniref:carbohydrate kinase family protein n=1 Tax=Arthrobacter sp. MI7-26 TaxID=2993653 RepID=UPI002248EA84|nr:carbohydrate kinase [Arthrobacter sp. MI7-26]MCX2748776.1 carbohydrate kinase [Arthrobacter sp. MI7-26]